MTQPNPTPEEEPKSVEETAIMPEVHNNGSGSGVPAVTEALRPEHAKKLDDLQTSDQVIGALLTHQKAFIRAQQNYIHTQDLDSMLRAQVAYVDALMITLLQYAEFQHPGTRAAVLEECIDSLTVTFERLGLL